MEFARWAAAKVAVLMVTNKRLAWGANLKHKFGRVVALTLMAVALFATRVSAETIVTTMFFDGFESDTKNVLNSQLVNWNVLAGSVDVLGANNLCGPSGDASVCLDLDGTGITAGTIQTKQSFDLDPGMYRLSFDLAGANRTGAGADPNTVTVSLGNLFSEDFTRGQWDPFTTFTRDIEVSILTSANIGFQHQGSDWVGLLLDNVSLSHLTIVPDVPEVDPNPEPTPEPGTISLLIGAAGIAIWGFRKKNQ